MDHHHLRSRQHRPFSPGFLRRCSMSITKGKGRTSSEQYDGAVISIILSASRSRMLNSSSQVRHRSSLGRSRGCHFSNSRDRKTGLADLEDPDGLLHNTHKLGRILCSLKDQARSVSRFRKMLLLRGKIPPSSTDRSKVWRNKDNGDNSAQEPFTRALWHGTLGQHRRNCYYYYYRPSSSDS